MKEIYINSPYSIWNEQEIIIPIKFPFRSKKHMMDTIGSHWEDPEKVLNILDNRIKKGILFDMVLKVSNRGGQYKRFGIKQFRYLISFRPYILKLEELRLHEKKIKKGKYIKYLIPNPKQISPYKMDRKTFLEDYKYINKYYDSVLFKYSLHYVLYNLKAL